MRNVLFQMQRAFFFRNLYTRMQYSHSTQLLNHGAAKTSLIPNDLGKSSFLSHSSSSTYYNYSEQQSTKKRINYTLGLFGIAALSSSKANSDDSSTNFDNKQPLTFTVWEARYQKQFHQYLSDPKVEHFEELISILNCYIQIIPLGHPNLVSIQERVEFLQKLSTTRLKENSAFWTRAHTRLSETQNVLHLQIESLAQSIRLKKTFEANKPLLKELLQRSAASAGLGSTIGAVSMASLNTVIQLALTGDVDLLTVLKWSGFGGTVGGIIGAAAPFLYEWFYDPDLFCEHMGLFQEQCKNPIVGQFIIQGMYITIKYLKERDYAAALKEIEAAAKVIYEKLPSLTNAINLVKPKFIGLYDEIAKHQKDSSNYTKILEENSAQMQSIISSFQEAANHAQKVISASYSLQSDALQIASIKFR